VTVYRGPKTHPRRVECRAVGCEGEMLDPTLKEFNAGGWDIRQIFQELPSYYRIFAQRETPV
jgi:hypothetical protein